MVFDSEAAFEDAVVEALCSYGWGDVDDVIVRPTEQELIDNWAAILFDRNKHRDNSACPEQAHKRRGNHNHAR